MEPMKPYTLQFYTHSHLWLTVAPASPLSLAAPAWGSCQHSAVAAPEHGMASLAGQPLLNSVCDGWQSLVTLPVPSFTFT